MHFLHTLAVGALGGAEPAVTLSEDSRTTAGFILLTFVVVEWGGWAVLRFTRGQSPATPLQTAFARAGHGHAGVLLVLALVGQILADAADMTGVHDAIARTGIWLAAILMPAGFFLSTTGPEASSPNRLVALVYVGAALLTAGVVALGIGLLTT